MGNSNKRKRIFVLLLVLVTLACSSVEIFAVNENVEVNNPVRSTLTIDDIHDSKEISLVMVGDVLMHERVQASALNLDGTYDYSSIFRELSDEIRDADVALINQEVILGGQELGLSYFPRFNAPYELADAIVNAGFDVICHANNHALDQGAAGIKNCLNNWDRFDNIIVAGLHRSQKDQDAIRYIKIDGVTIAILNYTSGTNKIAMPKGMTYAVDKLKKERVIADITSAKNNSDFVIVCPHWGKEYDMTPSEKQKYWTEIFLENGVDLVIGTHPHVIQPIEMLTAEDGHQMLVYYSLGNFVSWTNSQGDGIRNRVLGGMAEVQLKITENEVSIADYNVRALITHLEDRMDGVTVYPLAKYPYNISLKNEIASQDINFSTMDCMLTCNRVWHKWH